MRDEAGTVRVFFGVTDDGLSEVWKQLVASQTGPDELDADDEGDDEDTDDEEDDDDNDSAD